MERVAEGSGDTGNIPQTRTFPSVAHHGAAAEPSRAEPISTCQRSVQECLTSQLLEDRSIRMQLYGNVLIESVKNTV